MDFNTKINLTISKQDISPFHEQLWSLTFYSVCSESLFIVLVKEYPNLFAILPEKETWNNDINDSSVNYNLAHRACSTKKHLGKDIPYQHLFHVLVLMIMFQDSIIRLHKDSIAESL